LKRIKIFNYILTAEVPLGLRQKENDRDTPSITNLIVFIHHSNVFKFIRINTPKRNYCDPISEDKNENSRKLDIDCMFIVVMLNWHLLVLTGANYSFFFEITDSSQLV
jgi:hypothetical protein